MKKKMMLAGLIMISTIVFAQRPKADPAAMAARRSEKMKTELSLNDDQYARVKAINEKFAASRVALRKDTSLTIGTAHKRAEKMKTDHEAELKKVLTEAQWTKWSDLKKKSYGDRKRHGHDRGHDRKGDKG